MRSFLLSTILFLVGGQPPWLRNRIAETLPPLTIGFAPMQVRENAVVSVTNGGGLSGSWNFRGPGLPSSISVPSTPPAHRRSAIH